MKLLRAGMLVLLLVYTLVFSPVSWAQTTAGRIIGRIVPAPGENQVPSAPTITLSDLDSVFSSTMELHNSSVFEFPSVPPGRYRITVEAAGRAASSTEVEASTSGANSVVALQVGALLDVPHPVLGAQSIDVRDLSASPPVRSCLVKAEHEMLKGQFRGALQEVEKAVRMQPDLPLALSALGCVLMKLKRADDAEKAYSAALETAPDYSAALRGIGYLYLSTAREDKAIPFLLKEAALHDRDGLVWSWLGEALYQVNKYPQAEEALSRALILDDSLYHASYRLAFLYLQTGRRQQALDAFRIFLKTNAGLDPTKVLAIVARLDQE